MVYQDNFRELDANYWSRLVTTISYPDRPVNVFDPAQVYCDVDGLHIKAEKMGDDYYSGQYATINKLPFTYGYFETKLRFPSAPGAWANFFLVNNDGWPPEIDTCEIFANDGYLQLAIFDNNGVINKHKIFYGGLLLDRWHVFGVLWDADNVVFYMDKNEIWRTSVYVPSVPMAMYYFLGMGEYQDPDDSQLPAYLDVEYVRVWQIPA